MSLLPVRRSTEKAWLIETRMDTVNLENKRVLVTGADGFIGSHLAEHLVQMGASVRALALYNSIGSWGWLDNSPLNGEMEIVLGDVRDPHCCQKITADIDVVFNLAALITIPYSYIAPNSYLETNVKGALNICHAALENNIERVVQISTSEVYGTARYVPIDEAHPLQPQSPYSASKIGSDALAMSYFYSFDLPLVVARPFNTYGPRQSARSVIPTIITQIATGSKNIKLGDLSPTRDFTYVSDTCRGLYLIAECDEAIGKTVNIGSNYEISMGEVAQKIRAIMNSSAEIVHEDERIRPKNSEVNRLWCDNSLMNHLTGFEIEYCLEAGLSKTIDWFCVPENLKKYKGGLYYA